MKNIYCNNSFKFYGIVIFTIAVLYYISSLLVKSLSIEPSFFNMTLFVICFAILGENKIVFWFLLFPLVFLHALYLPISLNFGPLDYDILIAGLSSSGVEVMEFVKQFEYRDYYQSIAIILSIILYRYLKVHFNIKFHRNQTFLLIACSLSMFTQVPTLLVRQIQSAAMSVYNEYQLLNSIKYNNDWQGVQRSQSDYQTYVLVIGESARRDYHHVYGYPIENTPFMSGSLGQVVTGLTAGGKTTVPSLRIMLTAANINDGAPQYQYNLNIIGLARKAGLKTYWLSNQGYFGTHDTPISALAQQSHENIFLKLGAYDSKNTKDIELLGYFSQILLQNTKKDKLIILHLYGSHYNACDRIDDNDLLVNIRDKKLSYMNCYVASIYKTDQLLQQLYNLLLARRQQYSEHFNLLYFSDHGLVHKDFGQVIGFANYDQPSIYHYDVPLFNITSRSQSRIECTAFKHPGMFTNGLANWLKINAEGLDPQYSLFDCQDDAGQDQLFNHLKTIVNDPAYDLRSY